MTIPIICEECGKLYHIPKDKLRNIKGDMAKTRCRNCGFVMLVNKSLAEAPDELEELDDISELSDENEAPARKPMKPPAPVRPSVHAGAQAGPMSTAKRGGLGLKAKMIVLFLVVPLMIIAAAGYFTQRQTNMLIATLVNQTTDMVTSLAEEQVVDMSRAVSRQIHSYLSRNPAAADQDFSSDPIVNGLAVQQIGKAGFTFLYTTKPFTILASPDPSLNGKTLAETMKTPLGSDWARLERLIAPLDRGENIQKRGYVSWVAGDGKKHERFMAMTPVPGTNYGVAAAAGTKASISPLDEMRSYAGREAVRTKNTNFTVTLATLIIIGLIVIGYGHILVKRIKKITDVANRISVGELDAEMDIRSDDELGSLADAIGRMQESLRASITRLRRRQ
jgi:HAMP domain-containing protein